MKSFYIKPAICIITLCISSLLTYAQNTDTLLSTPTKNNTGRMLFTAGWQINSISNNFVCNTSGRGSYIEVSYDLRNKWSVGVFVAWHTNNQYIPQKTYVNNTSEITTAMYHGIYQVPFGGLVRYTLTNGKMFTPYAAFKIGTNYSEQSIYLYLIELLNRNWGLYLSPEIGTYIFPSKKNRLLSLHVAAYYGFATNSFDFLTAGKANNLNNIGLRIGGAVNF